jgi:molybdenum-dependent DNA-binding transcriptional regulator ModE
VATAGTVAEARREAGDDYRGAWGLFARRVFEASARNLPARKS